MTAPSPGRISPADTSAGGGVAAAHICRVAVAVLLTAVAGLVLLALGPRLVGFQGHVVVSGSMEPQFSPGDVVLTRPVLPRDLQPGQVLLFPDPEGADRLLLHRLVSLDERGNLVTRGDANQSNDATQVPAASIIGQAQLRVPYIGLPAYWRGTGQWGHLGLLAVLLAAATVATRGPATEPRRPGGAHRAASSPVSGRAARRPARARSTSAPRGR